MAMHVLTEGNDYYESTLIPTGSETGNKILALGGHDTVIGNGYVDLLFGDAGNDYLDGAGGNDIIIGETGNDTLLGANGNDFIHGGEGHDALYGGTGADTLFGGTGDDAYEYYKSNGSIDIANDNKSPTGETGYGGGTDYVWLGDVIAADLRLVQNGDDLYVTDVADLADGRLDTGVIMEDFFLGGNNVIEYLFGADGLGYDLTPLIA